MILRVLFFGHYRDVVPEGSLSVEVAEGASVADLARALAADNARLSDLLARTRVAVQAEFAGADTILRAGDEVAFLPPMSGG